MPDEPGLLDIPVTDGRDPGPLLPPEDAAPPPEAPPPETPETQPEDFYLVANDHTRYRTREAAEAGIAAKDQTIDLLRTQLQETKALLDRVITGGGSAAVADQARADVRAAEARYRGALEQVGLEGEFAEGMDRVFQTVQSDSVKLMRQTIWTEEEEPQFEAAANADPKCSLRDPFFGAAFREAIERTAFPRFAAVKAAAEKARREYEGPPASSATRDELGRFATAQANRAAAQPSGRGGGVSTPGAINEHSPEVVAAFRMWERGAPANERSDPKIRDAVIRECIGVYSRPKEDA